MLQSTSNLSSLTTVNYLNQSHRYIHAFYLFQQSKSFFSIILSHDNLRSRYVSINQNTILQIICLQLNLTPIQ